jgi:hypothetical protein
VPIVILQPFFVAISRKLKTMRFDKIIFTGDVLRISSKRLMLDDNPFLDRNIIAIFNLISPIVSEILCCQSEFVSGNEIDCSNLIFKKLGLPLNEQTWASYYEDSSEFPEIERTIMKYFNSKNLIIGWELPPYITKIFRRNNITYIDISLHPFRFMPDLIFGARSNNAEIYQRFYRSQVPMEILYNEIRILKARSIRFSSTNIIPGAAVFLGQVEVDCSLI